jgi:Spy/CpxP family protein refolding chaperone
LTEQQQEQLEQILEKGRDEMRADRIQMLKLRRELRELVVDGADEEVTNAKIDMITALEASMMKQRIALLGEAREVLTEEQREVLTDIGLPMIGFGRHGPGGRGAGRGMRHGGHEWW